jgi:hypothetical protein
MQQQQLNAFPSGMPPPPPPIPIGTTANTTTDSTAQKKMNFDAQFDLKYPLLEKFTDKYGEINIQANNLDSVVNNDADFAGLGKWVLKMRRQLRLDKRDPTDVECHLDSNQKRRLAIVGLDLKTQNQAPEPSFDEMVYKLEVYKQQKGHCAVPSNPKSAEDRLLREWVERMRQAYSKFKEGRRTTLDALKIAKMTRLGFQFRDPKAHFTSNFHERSLEWLEYKTKNGCNPPKSTDSPEDGLGKWVELIRKHYDDFRKGKSTKLTQEHVDRLTEWGFDFVDKTKPARTKSWEERFAQLVSYKEKEGDVIVPMRMPGLGGWVKQQRKDYKNFLKGELSKNRLSEERIAKLESIGFIFDATQFGAFKWKLQKSPSDEPTEGTNNNDHPDPSSSPGREGDEVGDEVGDTFAPWDRYNAST